MGGRHYTGHTGDDSALKKMKVTKPALALLGAFRDFDKEQSQEDWLK
jgi:hypothetical protein